MGARYRDRVVVVGPGPGCVGATGVSGPDPSHRVGVGATMLPAPDAHLTLLLTRSRDNPVQQIPCNGAHVIGAWLGQSWVAPSRIVGARSFARECQPCTCC